MTVQVLVVTMNQPRGDFSLLEKMNICSDAIVCNQCDRNETEEFTYKGHRILWMNFAERGVGLNRNNALMRSDADISILADDDMVFCDGYEKTVLEWFGKLPRADMLFFHLVKEDEKPSGTKIKKVGKHNYGKYGAARIAFRSKKIKLHGIFFSTMFGGGCPYSCGEDSLFISHCLEKGLRMYEVPASLARMTEERESSWFSGYNDKYFFDKGVLYYMLSSRFCHLFSLYHCIKHRKKYQSYGWRSAWKKMEEGISFITRQ